jgi:hypothetical protein
MPILPPRTVTWRTAGREREKKKKTSEEFLF